MISIGCPIATRHYWTYEITKSVNVHKFYALNSTLNKDFKATMHQAN